MAAIVAAQVTQLYSDGGAANRTCLFRVLNVTTADTLDLSAMSPTLFNRLASAVWIPTPDGGGATLPSGGGVVGTLGNGATGVNNRVTFTLTSLANATVLLLVQGNPSA